MIGLFTLFYWQFTSRRQPKEGDKPPPPPVAKPLEDTFRLEAVTDIPANVVINSTMVKQVPIVAKAGAKLPEEWLLRSQVVTPQPAAADGKAPPPPVITITDGVINHVSKTAIALGTKLEKSMVAGHVREMGLEALVPPGRVAMTVRITRDGPRMIQQLVKPGNVVDILATFKSNNFTKTIIRDARVVAVDIWADGRATPEFNDINIAQSGPYAKEYKAVPPPAKEGEPPPPAPKPERPLITIPTLTLAVTPKESEVLELADAYAELNFVVHGKREGALLESSGVPVALRSGGTRATEISPLLTGNLRPKEERPEAKARTGRVNVATTQPSAPVLPPAPVTATSPKSAKSDRPEHVPTPAPLKEARPAKSASRATDTHAIEVFSPRGLRVVEVPVDGS